MINIDQREGSIIAYRAIILAVVILVWMIGVLFQITKRVISVV